MGAQQRGLMADEGPAPSKRSLLFIAAASLAALVWLLAGGGGGGPLRGAVAAARLRWYAHRGTEAARPPALHGLVHKSGPINMTLFYPPLGPPCKAERLWWYGAAAGRGSLTRADLARLRRGPCMPCQVYVNHLYKIIYVRHPKVASSTLLDYFGLCEDETKGCLHGWEVDMASLQTTPEVAARPTSKQLSKLSEAEVAAVWRDYFVFTITRDPLDRAVSQYSFLMRSNLADPPGCAAASEALDWDRFCASPPAVAKFCARRPDCCKQAEGLYDGTGFKLAHIAPQAPCITTPDGRLAVDFVVRQERLADDLGELLQALNARRGAGVPPLDPGRALGTEKMRQRCASGRSERAPRHGAAPMQQGAFTWEGMVAKEQYCTTDEYYAGRHAHCKASIAAYFADDLRLLYGGGGGG